MPRNISFSSPSTSSNGWRLPCAGRRPGSVMSMASAARRCASTASESCFVRAAMSAVMASRTSFARAPITGRSSAESLPICFRMAVTSPFLPKKRTRSSSTSAALAALAISSSAVALMCSNACFNKTSPFLSGTKKGFAPVFSGTKPVRSTMLRGTTHVFASKSKHSLLL